MRLSAKGPHVRAVFGARDRHGRHLIEHGSWTAAIGESRRSGEVAYVWWR